MTPESAASRAAWIYGQPMAPCPSCGGYNMKPQLWARATKAGATPIEGPPCYYACWDCGHKGPAVNCIGRTSKECRADPGLNAEMKRLWNTQTRLEGGHER